MSTELESLSKSVQSGRYQVAAEKVALAIMEWYMGHRLGDERLRLTLQISPTNP